MAPWNRDKRETSVSRIWNRMLAIIVLFMAGSAALFGVYSLLANSAMFIPNDAKGVLKSIKKSDEAVWSSESVRLYKAGGMSLRQDAVRGAMVDLKSNKFQLQVAGVMPKRTYYASDGVFTVRLSEDEENWVQITDICKKADPIPASTVEMPTPDDFLAAKPSMLTDEGTFLGDRAWVLKFEATPAIVRQLLMLDFFKQANRDESNAAWVISDKERKIVNEGDFKTVDGLVWVNRGGDRQIQQIDLRVELSSGTKYRFLSQRVESPDEGVLTDLDLGQPTC